MYDYEDQLVITKQKNYMVIRMYYSAYVTLILVFSPYFVYIKSFAEKISKNTK